MLSVRQIESKTFTSNAYLIESINEKNIWLVDCGAYESILPYLRNSAEIKGVFITHPHYDHIQGLNALVKHFPACSIYCSTFAKEGLYSAKLNLSFYHDNPFELKSGKVCLLEDEDSVDLFPNFLVKAFWTPGHHIGSLVYQLNEFLFTGDSYIPPLKTVTKLKGGNKLDQKNSETTINQLIQDHTVLCPGHGAMGNLQDVIKENKIRFGHIKHLMS